MAEFYDPLYFDYEEIYVDPFRFVDVEYTSESAAYRRLSTREESKIPAFYGTYTLDLIAPPASSRSVRLILLGYIDGAPMNTVWLSKLNRPYRKVIMKRIVSAKSRLYDNDVIHNAVHPRNLIIQELGGRDLSTYPSARLCLSTLGMWRLDARAIQKFVKKTAFSPGHISVLSCDGIAKISTH